MGDVEGANSKTFKILEPKRRKQYSESESLRHPLAKGAVRAKEFELTDPELLVKFVNAQTGQVNTAFLHMNSMAISDEEVFTVSPPAGVQLGNREARAVLEGEGHPPDFPTHHADTPCCASSQAHAVNWSAAS